MEESICVVAGEYLSVCSARTDRTARKKKGLQPREATVAPGVLAVVFEGGCLLPCTRELAVRGKRESIFNLPATKVSL